METFSFWCLGWKRYYGFNISINSLWPSDTVLRHRSESTLVQVMACCLMASPGHQCTNHPPWPSDEIWWHASGSTWVQVMACCLMVPSHYLNHCWPEIIGIHPSAILFKTCAIYASETIIWNWNFCASPCHQCVNSSPPGAANMRQWIRSKLFQIMACHLFGAKPLSKPMLGYCQLNP